MTMTTYIVSGNGAAICSRDTREEAIGYAEGLLGWEHHRSASEASAPAVRSFRVEQHEWDDGLRRWMRTFQDTEIASWVDPVRGDRYYAVREGGGGGRVVAVRS